MDAGGIVCDGAIEVVKGFVAGLKMEVQKTGADFVSICVEAITDNVLKGGLIGRGEGRGVALRQKGPIEGDGCLSM